MPLLDHEPLTRHRPEKQSVPPRRARLGFLGVGWVGRHRLRALARTAVAEVVAICDPSPDALQAAAAAAPEAALLSGFDALLATDLDGLVIATPSALHAGQALAALTRGQAVFCQKPLARTAGETRQIIDAARDADVLLGVDFCYRDIAGAGEMQRLIQSGELGEIFAIDVTFHNAYGPDKAWFYEPSLSGGGCVIDLGIHLADFVGWITRDWKFQDVRSTLWRQGVRLNPDPEVAEDFALAQWRQPDGADIRLACSWNLSAGQDAVIEAKFYGTRGSAALRNINGSFFRFACEHYAGTQRRPLEPAVPAREEGRPIDPNESLTSASETEAVWDEWGGTALVRWARRLSEGAGFDPEIESAESVAALLDSIYGRAMTTEGGTSSRQHSGGVV